MSSNWYVVRTRPHAETRAISALEREGFTLFAPRIRSAQSPGGAGDVALFPGYVFMRFDADVEEWPSLTRLPGVVGWLQFEGVVPSVPDDVIDALTERVDAINSRGGLWPSFVPGQKVRVVSGTLESFAQIIEEPRSPQARAKVLLEFMGRMVSAQVPWHSLQPVNEGTSLPNAQRPPRRTRGKGRWVRGFGPRSTAKA